ncbi:MAG TPA: hypothetical protein VHH90_07645 [Polyangia bacterium]|nr:hypothetical protein [Polyangia bacterium]HVY41098.1 hypothetical protein [Polyangia bacterium]
MRKPSSLRRGLPCFTFALALAACATSRWPDEPGKPVTVSQAANVDVADQFFSALTAARRAHGLSEPIVTPRNQSDIRNFAEDLQAGRTSAPGAQRAIEAWGRVAYHGPVESWLLDCTGGRAVDLPPKLIEEPSAVLAYAAAQFRPASAPVDQCAVLVVARR